MGLGFYDCPNLPGPQGELCFVTTAKVWMDNTLNACDVITRQGTMVLLLGSHVSITSLNLHLLIRKVGSRLSVSQKEATFYSVAS